MILPSDPPLTGRLAEVASVQLLPTASARGILVLVRFPAGSSCPTGWTREPLHYGIGQGEAGTGRAFPRAIMIVEGGTVAVATLSAAARIMQNAGCPTGGYLDDTETGTRKLRDAPNTFTHEPGCGNRLKCFSHPVRQCFL